MPDLTLEQALKALGYEPDDVADYQVLADHVVVELHGGRVLTWPPGIAPEPQEVPARQVARPMSQRRRASGKQ